MRPRKVLWVFAGLALVALVAACAPAPQPPVNLLLNPGFERGVTSPDSWTADVFQPTATMAWDPEVHRGGGRSIRIDAPEPNDARWIQTVAVEPNTLYELSGWIRTRDVERSAQAVDAGANLAVMGTWTRTETVRGTNGWTYRSVRFDSGPSTSVTIGARLGFWSGTTTGTAWFDDVRLAPAKRTLPARWKVLVLIYGRTDIEVTGAQGAPERVVAQMSPAEIATATDRSTRFVLQDLPALSSGSLQPTVTVRTPSRTLDRLSPNGSGWWPSPSDTAAERDPAFDAVIVIWDPRGTNQTTGQSQWIGSAAGLTPSMGTGQMYTTLIAEAAVSYPHRNVFKHEFGHSILSYFEALGVVPLPAVNNHTDEGEYVHCPTGAPYVWVDELESNPVPNSIYNNWSGFTHDYYSGTVATAEQPERCLGISADAWAAGGPATAG